MALVYMTMVILGLLYFKKTTAPLYYRIVGVLFALVLLGISFFFSTTMPILKLDAPKGRYTVGTTLVKILDEKRDEYHTQEPNDKRELIVEIWYPGIQDPMKETNTLWSGLYSGENDVIRFFTNYLRKIHTHSVPNLEPVSGSFPLILFNHGLQMFTSQNTLLMEHLASHGYVVASIGHPYESIRVHLGQGRVVLPEFVLSLEKFKEGMRWIAESSEPILKARKKIATLTDREERSKIVLAAIEKADTVNETVITWTRDTQFVLSLILGNVPEISSLIPDIDTSKIGVMGMSIGGATAAELCKVDNRVMAGINLDGLHYGTTQNDSLNIPFMMFTSDDGTGMNDFLFLQSKKDYYEYHLRSTRHSDLTDMAIVWPILKFYGQSGQLKGRRVMEIMNTTLLDFWDYYLKGKTQKDLSTTRFPELHVEFKPGSA